MSTRERLASVDARSLAERHAALIIGVLLGVLFVGLGRYDVAPVFIIGGLALDVVR